MRPGTQQENVSKNKYGCTRTDKISVTIKYSHHHEKENQVEDKTVHGKTEMQTDVETDRNKSTLNRKCGKWRRYTRETKKD